MVNAASDLFEHARLNPPPPTSPAVLMAKGTARAASCWTLEEIKAVDAAIDTVALLKEEFTADDVWEVLGPDFPVTKGLAGRLRSAVSRGMIRGTGKTAIARRGGSHDHGQRFNVWASTCRS